MGWARMVRVLAASSVGGKVATSSRKLNNREVKPAELIPKPCDRVVLPTCVVDGVHLLRVQLRVALVGGAAADDDACEVPPGDHIIEEIGSDILDEVDVRAVRESRSEAGADATVSPRTRRRCGLRG